MTELTPSFDAFRAAYEAGKPQIVARSLVADLDTPVSAWMKLGAADPYSFLFESVQGGELRGRYSIIGLRPDIIWRCRRMDTVWYRRLTPMQPTLIWPLRH